MGGVALIEWTVRGLVEAGAKKIFCIVNERLGEVERFLLEGDFGAEVRVAVQTTKSSLFSLLALRRFLEGGPFLLATTDTILPSSDWKGFGAAAMGIRNLQKNGGKLDALLGVTGFVEDEDPLWVDVDEKGLARSIGPKSKESARVTCGLYAFHPSILADAAAVAERPGARLRHLLARLPESSRRIGTYIFRKTVDVDRPADLQTAERWVKNEGWG